MDRAKYFTLILGGCCWIVLLSFLIVPFTLLVISKCVVLLVAAIFRKDLYSVSTGDSAFTIGCSWDKSKLSVGLLCHVQGHLKLEQVQSRFSSCLLEPKALGDKPKYDKLYSCLVTFCGYVFRKVLPPDCINLKSLIFERKLQPGESLESLMESWMEKNYAKLSPAWELMVIPIYANNNVLYSTPSAGSDDEFNESVQETVIAFKIHHVFADGYSLLHMLDALTGNKSPYLVKESNESLWKTIADIISMPVNLRLLGGPGSPTSNPMKVTTPQQKWLYTFTTVDLGPIKAIRRKYEVHFATVILTLLVGSLKQYLLETQSKCDKKQKLLPSHLSVANTLPWEKHPSQSHILCNHWTLGVIKSPFSTDNRLIRVLETEKSFLEFHEAGLQKVAANYLFPFAWLLPARFAEKGLEHDVFGFNCGLTSLVGADNYEILGKRITHIRPLLTLIDSHPFTAFSWFTFSHSNKLDVTLAAAPDLFPDRQYLDKIVDEYFHTEFHALCNQCGIPSFSSSSSELS